MEEILKIVRDRWKAKIKGDKSRVHIQHSIFQKLSHKEKEIEENNKKGKNSSLSED